MPTEEETAKEPERDDIEKEEQPTDQNEKKPEVTQKIIPMPRPPAPFL